MIFDRMDTWILIGLWGSLIVSLIIEQHIQIKRLRKANKCLLRKAAEAGRAAEDARQQAKIKMDCMKRIWQKEMDSLREEFVEELEKKDKLLNQKWKAANRNECA